MAPARATTDLSVASHGGSLFNSPALIRAVIDRRIRRQVAGDPLARRGTRSGRFPVEPPSGSWAGAGGDWGSGGGWSGHVIFR